MVDLLVSLNTYGETIIAGRYPNLLFCTLIPKTCAFLVCFTRCARGACICLCAQLAPKLAALLYGVIASSRRHLIVCDGGIGKKALSK